MMRGPSSKNEVTWPRFVGAASQCVLSSVLAKVICAVFHLWFIALTFTFLLRTRGLRSMMSIRVVLSYSTVLLHVVFGLSTLRVPSGVHVRAVAQWLLWSILSTCPNNSISSVAPLLHLSLSLSYLQFLAGYIQCGPEKTAQTLMRYNFSTAGHRVTWFPAKCSETNW